MERNLLLSNLDDEKMMKKKYVKPAVHVVKSNMEPLLNGASIVDGSGKTQDNLGSDTTTGGTVGEGGYVWADAKQNSWSSIWDE